MKRVLSLILSALFVLMLCACEDKDDTADSTSNSKLQFSDATYNIETDMPYYYRRQGPVVSPIVCTNDGYYCVGSKSITIYIDKNTMKSTPLCSKLNCTHSDKATCDAYFLNFTSADMTGYAGSTSMQYYEGNIYYVESVYDQTTMSDKQHLVCVHADGTNRTDVTGEIDYEGVLVDWFLHRGYMYYITDRAIVRIDLNTKKTETIYELDNFSEFTNNISNITAYGDFLYFSTSNTVDETTISGKRYFLMNLKTKEVIPYGSDGEEIFIEAFCDGKVIYRINDDDSRTFTIYKSNPDLTNAEKVAEFPFGNQILCDCNYIYVDNGNEVAANRSKGIIPENVEYYGQMIQVFDKDFNKIDSFELPCSTEYLILTSQDPENFILYLPNEEDSTKYTLYAIDKSKIGTYNGKPAELIELCKTSWANPNDGYTYE